MKTNKTILMAMLLACSTMVASAQGLKETIEKGVQTSRTQSENHEWREAFATCRALDAQAGTNPELKYLVAGERFRLYSRLKKWAESKAQLELMENYARASKKGEVIEDMLMKKAYFAQIQDNTPMVNRCYREIFDMRAEGKDDKGKEECFKKMIAQAKSDRNMPMANLLGKMYEDWTDSIENVRRANELSDIKSQYAEAQEEIESKDSTISTQLGVITTLVIVGVGLAAALLFFIFMMLRNMRVIKRQKNSLNMANDNNTKKSEFLRNIGAQMKPALEAIEKGDKGNYLNALKEYISHIETFMALEQSRDEHFELTNSNMGKFCEDIAKEIRTVVKEGTEVTCSAQPIKFPTNEETLRNLVMRLVGEAIKDNGLERINLDFKKRNTHTGHLLVTAVGLKIADEKKVSIFQPFAAVSDLTESDGLTYPTCYLMACKMGGELRLDDEFKRGTRFVIVLKEE